MKISCQSDLLLQLTGTVVYMYLIFVDIFMERVCTPVFNVCVINLRLKKTSLRVMKLSIMTA